LFEIHEALQRAAVQAGGRVDAFFFCPHSETANCECRKPKPGMLLEVAQRFNVSLKDTYMVGDSLKDVQAAAAAGAKPVLVLTGKGKKTQVEGRLPPGTQVFADLAAFAEHLAP
jgi:D-glycero-D-manno-heptose 1,7-bisphosphate phosphatase